ncbi:MAG: hypothetical protein IKK99_00620 [Oscillospiraceae bacterium]|nr:hypothetical protein [Oscillospiraceae bacterium]MBR6608699.1 hypothetical protein [Oscillospiraceae bacterium]
MEVQISTFDYKPEYIKDGFEFVALNYPYNKKEAIKIVTGTRPIQEYIDYINKNNIDSAEIIMPNIEFLKYCPGLKHLKIWPSYDSTENFDFSPLYTHPEILTLHCGNQYGNRDQYLSKIDYSRINGIIKLSVSANKSTLNFNTINTLKLLRVGNFKSQKRDLYDLFRSKQLDTLELNGGNFESLNGIENTEKLQCLYLYYNRSLKDISSLRKVKKTIKALRIENCPKIEDFSVLAELENLELLELTGKNVLPDLKFINSMKNLKTFVFDMNVEDGDLTPCLNLSYVYCDKNRKHYNLKDKDLPKGKYVRGNEDIEIWRRLE